MPGKRVAAVGLDPRREGAPGSYEPGDPVDPHLSLLRVGSVYLGAVNPEIFNPVATRLKAESPQKHTMMVTLTNGTAELRRAPFHPDPPPTERTAPTMSRIETRSETAAAAANTPCHAPARRRALGLLAGAALLPLVAPASRAQPPAPPSGPISNEATPRDWSGQTPVRYPDPDIITLDPSFRRCTQFNTPILRLHTGTLWAEGPAWNGVGRFLVWSDIPNDLQLRWIEDDARVTRFRAPSNNSNGNTFDYQGRQLSAEHGARRVARYEPDGKVTVIADRYNGKRLNSPNDLVVHPDGSIWFTDPSFGIRALYEGNPGESETKEAVYRVDGQTGAITLLTDEVGQPNGLCFSPDYSKLYVADSGQIKVWDIEGGRIRNGRTFALLKQPDGSPSSADGIRCDHFGNIWCGARPGVLVANPEGQTIGAIRLPEVCANICFGGPKRNRLFMTASQSLYAVYVASTGAHIC